MSERPLYNNAIQKLALNHNKMAFIAGPRQVGKTTLALQIKDSFLEGVYYNWDDLDFKRQWTKQPSKLIPQNIGKKPLVVLDELHKAPRWKSILKGLYDLNRNFCRFIVTGSARLDIYRRGGDSLLGRYFLFRLHPFSVGELTNQQTITPELLIKTITTKELQENNAYDKLFQFGGFPDPLLKADEQYHRLWCQHRIERLVREDLIDLSRLRETALMQTLMTLLPEKVGSPLSVQSLSEDLQSNHPTTKRWLGWLEQIYYCYFLLPYSKKIAHTLQKQPKLYLWDWSEVKNESARFENMVAGHLLKAVHFWNDTGVGEFGLYYVRNKQKQEIDFLLTCDKKPWILVECKLNDTEPSKNLDYFSKILCPQLALQLVHQKGVQQRFSCSGSTQGVVMSADRFLSLLP